jgi:hypothetical protein
MEKVFTWHKGQRVLQQSFFTRAVGKERSLSCCEKGFEKANLEGFPLAKPVRVGPSDRRIVTFWLTKRQ